LVDASVSGTTLIWLAALTSAVMPVKPSNLIPKI
jgi:hypothetical protein